MYYGKAQETADHVKSILRDMIIDANLKQDVLANYGYVKQNTISQWLDPLSERHFPAFQLLLQPEEIVVPICREAVKRFGKTIGDNVFDLPTNGRTDDNIIKIDEIQGYIIRKRETDPKGALKYCDELIREAQTLKREIELQINK
jgi:hypothetical protein